MNKIEAKAFEAATIMRRKDLTAEQSIDKINSLKQGLSEVEVVLFDGALSRWLIRAVSEEKKVEV